jgi:tetraacyldisaccharide-1-P 4'-kinase
MPTGLQNAIEFRLVATDARRLNGSLTRSLDRFAGTTVHAVAAIGNPGRFFDTLRGHGVQVIEHAYPDHAPLDPDRFWYVPVDVEIDPVIAAPWLEQIESRMRNEQADND